MRPMIMKLDKMTDINADLLKVIYVMDSIPNWKKLPFQLIGGFMSWACGSRTQLQRSRSLGLPADCSQYCECMGWHP